MNEKIPESPGFDLMLHVVARLLAVCDGIVTFAELLQIHIKPKVRMLI